MTPQAVPTRSFAGYGPPGGHGSAPPGMPPAGSGGGGPPGRPAKPITGSPETMALHAMTIDPRTGLPKGESPPASTAAVVSLVCGVLLCLGPLTGFPAVIAGVMGRRAAREDPAGVGGERMALVGLLLGVFNLVVSAVGLLILLISAL